MAVTVKSHREIELMRHSCQLLAEVFDIMSEAVAPGISTWDIDKIGEEAIRKLGGVPNFKGYNGFPAAVCVSVNDQLIHGIPSKKKILKDGDIVSLDCGLIYKNYHSDAARTYPVGTIAPELEKLVEVTKQSFFEGIKFARAGRHLHEISAAIGNYAAGFGYGVVRDFVGHGIGTHLHEDPEVPNYPCPTRGILLRPGMTLAIEPMINMGSPEVYVDEEDEWTVYTVDGNYCAHYENTILITEDEPEILTIKKEQGAVNV